MDEAAQIEQWRQQAILDESIELMQERTPWRLYCPHAEGQQQFHQSPHIVRGLFPGNGFGKTRASGTEVAWWIHREHPWAEVHHIPTWPLIVIWACETYKQFEILHTQLVNDCFGQEWSKINPWGWKFNKQEKCYRWPNGDQMFLISGDGSWTHIQGINPDLVIFDEEPPRKLWAEMQMRRRGARKTRFVFSCTATQGLTFTYNDLYLPWMKTHEQLGLNESQAIEQQKNPTYWLWPKGGINDNPGADQGDREWYASRTFASEAERQVRLGGGFQDFAGTPVFDPEALAVVKPGLIAGETGTLTPLVNDAGKTEPGRYVWTPQGATQFGRITIFEHPQLGEDRYVIGHDSAYGLSTGDFDYAVVLSRNTGRQVAEAQGRWGDVNWALVLSALYWYYGQAFMVGERQVGLMVMRRLYDEMGIGYQYYDRDQAKRAPRRSDTLGHHRRTGDLTIPMLRRALGPRDGHGRLCPPEVVVRSIELHRQLTKFQFRPRAETKTYDEVHDDELEYGAPTGDHDDGVLALGYARMGLSEVAKFEPPPETYKPGTYGHTFKIDEKLNPKPPTQPDPFARE